MPGNRLPAGQRPADAMSTMAPWRNDPSTLGPQIRFLERRVAQLEDILSRPSQSRIGSTSSVVSAPEAPLFPPPASFPKALDRVFDLKKQCHEQGKQLQLLYDFLLTRFPGAVPQLEAIQRRGQPLTPDSSDDLDLRPSGVPPTDVDGGDTEATDPEAAVIEDPETPSFPSTTPTTPAKRRRQE